jgi:hypothetical protein
MTGPRKDDSDLPTPFMVDAIEILFTDITQGVPKVACHSREDGNPCSQAQGIAGIEPSHAHSDGFGVFTGMTCYVAVLRNISHSPPPSAYLQQNNMNL